MARRFPNVKFEHATGYMRLPNLATYDARFYEGRFVIGQIAARVSRTGIMGYVGAFPIPEVVAGINSFMLGAKISPRCDATNRWEPSTGTSEPWNFGAT